MRKLSLLGMLGILIVTYSDSAGCGRRADQPADWDILFLRPLDKCYTNY